MGQRKGRREETLGESLRSFFLYWLKKEFIIYFLGTLFCLLSLLGKK